MKKYVIINEDDITNEMINKSYNWDSKKLRRNVDKDELELKKEWKGELKDFKDALGKLPDL